MLNLGPKLGPIPLLFRTEKIPISTFQINLFRFVLPYYYIYNSTSLQSLYYNLETFCFSRHFSFNGNSPFPPKRKLLDNFTLVNNVQVSLLEPL